MLEVVWDFHTCGRDGLTPVPCQTQCNHKNSDKNDDNNNNNIVKHKTRKLLKIAMEP